MTGTIFDERARIAQDLHDTLGHAITVIALRAAGARRSPAGHVATRDRALASIERSAVRAMTELHHVLEGLDMPGERDLPGIEELPDLLESVAGTGVSVTIRATGNPVPLVPGAGGAAYRVVQEALTNVIRHAGPGASVRVTLTWAGGLRVQVTDDGGRSGEAPAVHAPSSGRGLPGLRERVHATGGRLLSGPVGAGFTVAAEFPALSASSRPMM
ncbi:hypothetical protein J4573_23695 [Actinomadura barringtoniae]|uniref:histidine kinase n=1 Tax=Actinomadura barringtoniae TaxID=1427535 RepID=A0A939T8A6_9ACTN|nr:histidine kinase [Actinomadura barringtoniae]MBO2450127.1 hypothetical protein [Actinomadura barringtoniae]